jgi:hypothetical protein
MHDGEPHSAAPLTWLAAAFVAASSTAIVQIGSDARWLAAIGALIARARAIPHAVAYAAVPSDGWHDAPALGQLTFHGLESLFGDKGLVLAQVAAVTTAVAVLAVDLRRADARDGAAAAVLLAVVVAAPATFFVVRAELFSLAFFPVLVLLLRSESTWPSKRIWLVVPLLALWANLHGGVLLGFGVLGAYLMLRRARSAPLESACVLAASCLALLATPVLLGSVTYYTDVLGGGAVSERYGLWGRLSPHEPLDLLFVAIAAPLVVAAVRRRPAAWELVLLAAFVVMSVEARRNGIWLVLFAATPAARSFGAWRTPLVSRRLAIACCAAPLLIAVVGLTRPVAPGGAGSPLLERTLSVAHGSPILADPFDAEQIALRGGRIWIGNPIDAFPRDHQRVYVEWLRGRRDGDAILRPPIRIVLVVRGSEPQKRLAGQAAFRELARDERAVLYAART